ncbi:MAG: tRNA lysidine(34) synthetase TilS, partial [Vibrio sp.]
MTSSTGLIQHFCRMLDQVRQPNTHWVVAFSGGLDSRVLLELLCYYRAHSDNGKNDKFSAVHIHHGLSANADAWAKACEQVCQALDIQFNCQRVNLDLGPQVSIEQAAREARYHALSHYVTANTCVLTGQHASDQLETVLLALKRGAGPKGLAAMGAESEFGQGRLVRPLLTVPQTQLADFAQTHQLTWINDESNQDTRFDRNYLRHQVIPQLTQRFTAIEKTVARSAALCAEQESLLHELLTDK